MPPMVEVWIAQLSSADPAQQAAAAEALAGLDGNAGPAAAALVRACGSDEEPVREWCAAALEELGPPPAEQIGELIELAGTSGDAAYWAITLLGRLGAAAAPAAEALAQTLSNEAELPVRERAAWALGEIGPAAQSAAPALRAATAGDQPRLARLAARALEALAD